METVKLRDQIQFSVIVEVVGFLCGLGISKFIHRYTLRNPVPVTLFIRLLKDLRFYQRVLSRGPEIQVIVSRV